MMPMQKIPVIVAVVIIIVTALIVFALNMRTISLPPDFQDIESNGLESVAKVFRNEQSIPHIISENDNDLFFTLGYCHAQDRLWQMDYDKRKAKGRLSEVFGKKTIDIDFFIRPFGLETLSRKIYDSLSEKTKQILTSYSNGINSFIENNEKNLSFEFGTLDYSPEKWVPYESIMLLRLYSLEQNRSLWADICFGEISDKIGVEKALELLPEYPENAPFILDDSSIYKAPEIRKKNLLSKIENYPKGMFRSFSERAFKYREKSGLKGSAFGSNAWAVLRNKSVENSPAVLANDPHFQINLPARFYQIHLTGANINVTGLSIPGIPIIFSGRNDNISWGFADMPADDLDFFIEKSDTSEDFYLRNDSVRHKYKFKKDTIRIKDRIDSVFYIRITDRSPVISEFHDLHSKDHLVNQTDNKTEDIFLTNYNLTYNWAGNLNSDEILAAYNIMKSSDPDQVEKSLKNWGNPAVNFIYADKKGNISIFPAGMIPERKEKTNPVIPNPGWSSEYGWKSIYRTKDLPKISNPDKKFLLAANNKISRNSEIFISNYWDSESRAQRIEMLLEEVKEYNYREAQLMQLDVLSPLAVTIVNKIIPVLKEDSLKWNGIESEALARLDKWDFIMSPGMPEATIFNSFMESFVYNTFKDELDERLYRQYISNTSFPLRKISNIINIKNSSWFDDVFTEKIETRDDIIKKSFKNTIQMLRDFFDNEPINEWKYGLIHSLTFKHVLSDQPLLKPTVTVGPFPMGGNAGTINNTEWSLLQPFDVTTGASMRFIADMGDSLVYTSLPGGVSGNPLSPHYADQIRLWLNGGYIELPVSRIPGERFIESLILRPLN